MWARSPAPDPLVLQVLGCRSATRSIFFSLCITPVRSHGKRRWQWSPCCIYWLSMQFLGAGKSCSSCGGCARHSAWGRGLIPLCPSPLPVGELQRVPWFGREPSYWGQCCLTAGTGGERGTPGFGFVFRSDPGCVGWAVFDSPALVSLPAPWGWCCLALWEYCSGY